MLTIWLTWFFSLPKEIGSNFNYCILNAGNMQPFFGENIRNRQPKSHFEAFQSEKYVRITKSAVVPVATWLLHPLRLDALSRIAARASHGGRFAHNTLWLGLFRRCSKL
jgi:hypothetical protein